MIIVAFAVGITVFRQTKAIWDMDSTNAVTINNSLNSMTAIEPLLIIVAIACILLALSTTKRGFGGI